MPEIKPDFTDARVAAMQRIAAVYQEEQQGGFVAWPQRSHTARLAAGAVAFCLGQGDVPGASKVYRRLQQELTAGYPDVLANEVKSLK